MFDSRGLSGESARRDGDTDRGGQAGANVFLSPYAILSITPGFVVV